MIEHVELRRGGYHDSVQLMAATSALQRREGVEEALVAMATPLNQRLLGDLGFVLGGDAGPDDLIVAVRTADEAALDRALQALDEALRGRSQQDAPGLLEPPAPRTIGSAAARVGANVALISVPGRHAFVEAMEAIEAGLNVMIFSDNVSLEHEVRLKEEAQSRGTLLMGPDCGTAIIGGVGLGFANATRPGPVSLAGASGTGIQHLSCLLDDAGVGLRHALGTGSRDLSAAVGGLSTIAAVRRLDEDPGTELIVVVSKPPDPSVADRVRAALAECSTPAVEAFVGQRTLEEAATEVCERLGRPTVEPAAWPSGAGSKRVGVVRGMFSGGTLRDEALMILEPFLSRAGIAAEGHTLVDFGDDRFTRGRAHPMIDLRFRLDALAEASSDPSVAVILLDLVLGFGSHPNPAPQLAPIVARATQAGIAVVACLIGTEYDPQGRDEQRRALIEAGASVFASNAAAVRFAAGLIEGGNR